MEMNISRVSLKTKRMFHRQKQQCNGNRLVQIMDDAERFPNTDAMGKEETGRIKFGGDEKAR